ncbi:MAG: DNA polymerase/3'-5' exonuclease PolX [bacterium]
MNNQEISKVLEEVATLLALKKDNEFKIRAYKAAAEKVSTLNDDIANYVESETIQDVKGIGPSISEKIKELVRTGKLGFLKELKKTVPAGLVDMLKIPGLGTKKIHLLNEKLSITTISELESACKNNKLIDIEGFSKKTQDNILKGIEYINQFSGQYLYDFAQLKAGRILEYLKKNKKFTNLSLAGSIRRHKEIVKDIDIVASGSDVKNLMEYFTKFTETSAVIAKGETKTSIRLIDGINVDLRIVESDLFPYALHHFTGSKDHNTAMRGRSKNLGIKMNEYGLFKQDKLIRCRTEEEIFSKLNLSFIPPELRENMGEIEAAEQNKIPKLIEESDLKGVLHVHSKYSDGINDIETLVKGCISKGLSYLGLCDHSQSAYYANGLKEPDLLNQIKEIDLLNIKYKDFKIFKGIESDIRPDGTLDYPEHILSKLDFVIGSIHSRFNMPEREMTNRILNAIKNPYFTILGHPTGRLLLAREGYKIDLIKIIDDSAKYGKIIELNSNPQRFDLDWRYLKYAKQKGVLISINPDAHTMEDIDDMFLGIGVARKGWLEPDNVINTFATKKIIHLLGNKKP